MAEPLCQNCRERPATRRFALDGTAMAHGWVEDWCNVCVLEAQIPKHREAAERLPVLEAELAAALAAPTQQPISEPEKS